MFDKRRAEGMLSAFPTAIYFHFSFDLQASLELGEGVNPDRICLLSFSCLPP